MARRPFTRNLFVPEGVQTGDGRIITPGALRWEDRPVAIRDMPQDNGWGHDGAVDLPGVIDTWERQGEGDRRDILASGWIDDELPHGANLAAMADAGVPLQISVDLDDVTVEIVDTMVVPVDDRIEVDDETSGQRLGFARFARYSFVTGDSPLRHHARPNAVTAAAGDGDVDGEIWWSFSMDEILERIVDGRLRSATRVGIPAFDMTELRLEATGSEDAGSGTDDAVDPEAVTSSAARRLDTGLAPSGWTRADADRLTVLASGGPVAPPRAWFETPEPDQLTPFTVTDDGQVFGHVWQDGACHVASGPGQCLLAPRSSDGFPWFHVGYVRTAEGTNIPTGALTIGGGHADDNGNATATREHYDNVATAWADVRIVAGRFGGWAAGAARPGITAAQLRTIRGAVPSGDWRGVGGRSELIGVHWVNRPGYPVARFDQAGQPLAIVAAAVIQPAALAAAQAGVCPDEFARLQATVRSLRSEVTADARRRLREVGTARARERLRGR